MVEMFFGNPGNRPALKAGHLTYPLVSKRLSGRLLCAMLLNGTFETCRRTPKTAACRGRPEVIGARPKRRFGCGWRAVHFCRAAAASSTAGSKSPQSIFQFGFEERRFQVEIF